LRFQGSAVALFRPVRGGLPNDPIARLASKMAGSCPAYPFPVTARTPVVKPSLVVRYAPLWPLMPSLTNCPPGENCKATPSRAGMRVTFPPWLMATTCQS
jgi:hypothetical protein